MGGGANDTRERALSPLAEQCGVYDRDQQRRCRNKPVVMTPPFQGHGSLSWHGAAMCQKHASQQAQHVLEQNEALVWALEWAESRNATYRSGQE